MRRAIDIAEGVKIDATAFKALVKAAVAFNSAPKANAKAKPAAIKLKPAASKAKPAKAATTGKVKLLSGGNPQIAKADGDAPVQAFIAAMPGWKHAIGKRLDAIITRSVPNVRKAVRWNTPFYGIEDEGFFVGFHCLTNYVKVAFFQGASLKPVPPIESKQKNVRYLDIHEDDVFDETQIASWIEQAAALPGWKL